MRIGIAANLKNATTVSGSPAEEEEEFDSPETAESIRLALENAGHEAVHLAGDLSILPEIERQKIDFVFNIAEGFRGRSREAHVPALLELAGIPYSGSDPLTLALTLDKSTAKFTALGAGVATPDFAVILDGEIDRASRLPFPLFVKPAWQGSSMGIRRTSRVENREELAGEVRRIQNSFPGQPVLVEQFLFGREFTVGVLGNNPPRVFGVMELKSSDGGGDFVYSLETKREWKTKVVYECPPKALRPVELKSLEAMALRLFEVFGCRDFARFDFRMDEQNKPYFLECNPLPGLNPESGDFVIMGRKQGVSYERVILGILEAARSRL